MEGGEEGYVGSGEAVEDVEGVGEREERYREVDHGGMDGVTVTDMNILHA